jgi:hypothetical protein
MNKKEIIAALEAGEYAIKCESHCGCSHGWANDGGELRYNGNADECWVGNILYVGAQAIAENIQFDGRRTLVKDLDADDIPEDIWEEMYIGEEEENEDHSARMRESLIDWIWAKAYVCYRKDGRFANEYTLLLASPESLGNEDYDDILTPEEFVEDYYRYPDPVTQSYVGVEIRD